VGIKGLLGFFILQLKFFTFSSQNLKVYLDLLELLLFRNVHHSRVWNNLRVGLLLGRIFVSSVGLHVPRSLL